MKKLSMPGGMDMAERRTAKQPGRKLKDGKAPSAFKIAPSGKGRKHKASR